MHCEFEHRGHRTDRRIPSTKSRAQSTKYRAQSTKYRAQSTKYRARNTECIAGGGAAGRVLRRGLRALQGPVALRLLQPHHQRVLQGPEQVRDRCQELLQVG